MSERQEDSAANLSIRPAMADDAELLWHWANDASVRERSFNPELIAWESHLDWFSQRLISPDTRFYLLLKNGEPIGQIRYDRDISKTAAEISFSIEHGHRGKGLGTEILRLTREHALHDLNCGSITALVIEGNEASHKAFVRAGFTNDGLTEIRGRIAARFIWRSSKKEKL